jgi:RND family efflux transporter MFP subunit
MYRPIAEHHRPRGSRPALVAAALAAVLGAAAGCGGGDHQRAPAGASATAVDVAVEPVRRERVPALHDVAGTVRAGATSTLAANLVGTVVRVDVAEGDAVRAGQVLLEIDSRDGRAATDRARAAGTEVERAIDAARAGAGLAEATLTRYEALHARRSVSTQELDEARARAATARAELARVEARRGEARATAAQADTLLDHSRVRAPVDGVVVGRFVDPGAQAAPGVPLLTVEDRGDPRVEAAAPEGLTVRAGDRVLLDAGEGPFEARVTRVQPSLDPAGRSALVKIALDRPLRSGAYVKVSFLGPDREALTVPSAAVARRGGLTSVFTVEDGTARMRLVTVGASAGGRSEVLAGLAAGERVVADASRVRDGARVGAAR